MRRVVARVALLVAVALLAAGAAHACPVCFGDANTAPARGIKAAVFVLFGITGAVFGGLGWLVLSIRRAARANRESS